MLLPSLNAAYAQDDPASAAPLPTPSVTSPLLTRLKKALAAEVGVRFTGEHRGVKLELAPLRLKPTTLKEPGHAALSRAVKRKIPVSTVRHWTFEPLKGSDCDIPSPYSDASECAAQACEVARRVGGRSLHLFRVTWDDQGVDDFVQEGVGIVIVDVTTSTAMTAYCTWVWLDS